MSTHKNFDKICVAVTVFALLLTILFMNGSALGLTMVVDNDTEGHAGDEIFTANDLNGDRDFTGATVITLNGDSAKIEGSGAYVNGNTVVIGSGGSYTISGSWNGTIKVDAYKSSKVFIQLNGLTVSNGDDACIWVKKADKVFLTLVEGTENILTGGAEYSEKALEAGRNAVIYSKDDLTINGNGSLTVTAGYKHGIYSRDELVITGGIITVDAVRDALRAKDAIKITGAELNLTAGDEGIQAVGDKDKTGSGENGSLYIESGTINITSDDDAIHTEGDIIIDGGTFNISAYDDAMHSETAITINDCDMLISTCYEGLEAPEITVNGGDIEIYPQDDGLNANGGSSIYAMPGDMGGMGMGGPGGGMGSPGGPNGMGAPGENGNPDGSATDGGMESEISESPEAAEAENQRIVSPDSSVTASEESSESEAIPTVTINGGSIRIINTTASDADGIDSNGDIIITGGDIFVSLPASGTNSAIDFGSENGGICEISGGTLVAAGSYSMAESFDSSSEQPSIMYIVSGGIEAGTDFILADEDENVLMSGTVPGTFSCIILSCPELELGQTYELTIGENCDTIELEEIAAQYGDAGSSMFGGTMHMSSMRPGGFGGRPGGFGGGVMPGGMKPDDGFMAPDNESEDSDGMIPPDKPEGNDGMEPPEKPDGDEGMAPPNMMSDTEAMHGMGFSGGQPPEKPEGTGEATQTEDMTPDKPDGMGDMMPPNIQNDDGMQPPEKPDGMQAPGMEIPPEFSLDRDETEESEDEEPVSNGKALSEFSSEIWIILAFSITALAAGIFIVRKYRR